jgi:hypothetical protein
MPTPPFSRFSPSQVPFHVSGPILASKHHVGHAPQGQKVRGGDDHYLVTVTSGLACSESSVSLYGTLRSS